MALLLRERRYRKGGKERGRGRRGEGKKVRVREVRKGEMGTPVCIFKFSLE